MSWLLRRRNTTDDLPEDGPRSPSHIGSVPSWARRFGRVGHGLDATMMEMQAVSIACDGGPDTDWSWVNAMAWRKTRYHEKWVNITMRVNGGVAHEFRSVEEAPLGELPPPDPADLAPLGYWAGRYEAIGALLDGAPGVYHAPTLIDLGDSVLVSALGWERARPGEWSLAGFGFTQAQIEARANVIAQARANLAVQPEKKR